MLTGFIMQIKTSIMWNYIERVDRPSIITVNVSLSFKIRVSPYETKTSHIFNIDLFHTLGRYEDR